MYWFKRLREILEEAKEAGKTRLEEYTTDGTNIMVSNTKARNSEILRVYQAEGVVLLR